MELDEALALIKQLKEKVSTLEETNEKLLSELYTANKKADKYLKELENLRLKKKIIAIKPFIQKNETLDNVINEPESIVKESKKRGIKPGSKKHEDIDFESLVSETRYEDPKETICPNCGSLLVTAISTSRYVIETIPASVKVVKIIKRSFKCPNCNKDNNSLFYPLTSLNNPFPGSILTPSFAAYILYHKYELGIPLNHISKHIKDVLNIEISKQSLADYVRVSAELLNPAFEQLKKDLLNSNSKVIHADETTLVVSKDKEKEENRLKSYVYVYASSFYDDKQINIYSFHESRKIDQTAKWLKDFNGTVICDDFPGYSAMAKDNTNIHLQRCLAHVRRKFTDILNALPEKERTKTTTYKILEIISKIFKFEEFYKKKEYTPSQIVEKRLIDQLPIKDKLYDIIFNNNYVKDSPIYSAINYTKNVWNDLWTYLDNGFVEPTNNVAERAVKPFVIQRKVFQTAGSYAGATYTTTIFSIIRSALINNIAVEPYLQYLFNNILNTKDTNSLMPYSDNIKNLFTNK